jgi:starch-binding outer membrane protein, SusD/RagB family
MKIKLYCLFALFTITAFFTACNKNLDAVPVNRLPAEIIYSDKGLVQATLANFYISVNFGQNNGDHGSYHLLDEANTQYGSPTTTDAEKLIDRNFFRTIDYGLVRRLNQFLEGIRSSAAKSAITETERVDMEAQCLFLRAWYYFCMTRSFGGMPIVGDEVFTYESGMDITPMQIPRSTEAEAYQYVIDQCDLAIPKLSAAKSVNASVANKWAAYMLKARAAVYAASIAKYGNSITPTIKTPGGEAGIPASKAAAFYRIAFDAAKLVINTSGYVLQKNPANPELAFYNATSVKANNTEVIWALDRKSPNQVTQFTNNVMPYSHRDYSEGNNLGALLTLVESFENRDGSNKVIKTNNSDGSYVFYDDVEDPFKAKDARLWGTVIWPNAPYRNIPVILQAGELNKPGSAYVIKTGTPGATDNATGRVTTALNGPASISNNYINKTGFLVRKFLDETPGAGLNPRFSEMWMPRFRIAEAYLIAAEAGLELGEPTALQYINDVRDRGRIQPLTAATFTFDKIVNEYRVEFAFEDHRFWDLKRWRLAHTIWNGATNDPTAHPTSLYPYKVVAAGDPNNGKWVFTRQLSYKRQSTPLYFPEINYYARIDLGWVANNPKLVLNPFQ